MFGGIGQAFCDGEFFRILAIAPEPEGTQFIVENFHQPGEDDTWRDLYRAIASRYTPKEWANAYVDNTDDQPRALCAIDLDAPSTQTVTWRMPIQGENPAGIWATRYYLPGTKMRPAATDL